MKIAVFPGDGIGAEVTREAVRVLEALDLPGLTLLEGDVVYLTKDDCWTRDLRQAVLLMDEADADLRLLQAEAQTGIVVGAYLADMQDGPDGPEPTRQRAGLHADPHVLLQAHAQDAPGTRD